MATETRRRYMKRWRRRNRNAVRAYNRIWYRRNRATRQEQYRFYNSGVTPEEYKRQLKKQKGKCGLCREKFKRGQARDADHDHKTGKFRGVIHRKCNLGLGIFGDSVRRLRLAIKYLTR